MAGHGPAPKPDGRRARRNSGPELRVVAFTPKKQPRLPASMDWCPETKKWWKMWGDSPLAGDFSESDWAFLMDTAILHHMLWSMGDTSVLSELRIRVAKFGATPDDRARLRIQFAQADDAEDRADRKKSEGSRSRARVKRVV